MGKAIPDRWLNYSPIGKRIAGTRFIAFKVPLRENINESVDDEELRLAPRSLLASVPNLGLIVDLTNTDRYYDPQTFEDKNVTHQKLCIPGHQTPPRALAQRFCQYVAKFLDANPDNDKLIGVHCTHGVNRTGYLICYYMILKMNISPTLAIQTFADARGHKIERTNYTQSLQHLMEPSEGSEPKERTEPRKRTERKSSSQHKSESNHYSQKEAKYFSQQNERREIQYDNWRSRPQEQQQQQHSYERRKFTHQQQSQPQHQSQRFQHHKVDNYNYDRRREPSGHRDHDNRANESRYQSQRNTRRYQSQQDESYNSRGRNYHPYSRNNNNDYNTSYRHNSSSNNNYNNNNNANKYVYNRNNNFNNNNNNRTESRTKLNHYRDHE